MKRKALLIGINNYQRVGDLGGCVNDVTNLRMILKQFGGFSNNDIRVIADSRATKSEIERRLGWLTTGAEPGDLLIMHFSGHGAQIRDRGEQDELSDDLDELICPFDMDWDGAFITDDELRRHLVVPPGVALEVVLDCCHSGEGQVTVGAAAPASSNVPGRKARFLMPPVDILSRHEGEALRATRRLFRSRPASDLVLWSGCAEFQTAADAQIGGTDNGAFTFFLCQHLRESQGRITRRELLARVRASLQQAGFPQIPELAASAGRAADVPFALRANP